MNAPLTKVKRPEGKPGIRNREPEKKIWEPTSLQIFLMMTGFMAIVLSLISVAIALTPMPATVLVASATTVVAL